MENQSPWDLVLLYEFESARRRKCGATLVDRLDDRHDENVRKWGPGVTTPIGQPMRRWQAEEYEREYRCDHGYAGGLGQDNVDVLSVLAKAAAFGVGIVAVAALLDALLTPRGQPSPVQQYPK